MVRQRNPRTVTLKTLREINAHMRTLTARWGEGASRWDTTTRRVRKLEPHERRENTVEEWRTLATWTRHLANALLELAAFADDRAKDVENGVRW